MSAKTKHKIAVVPKALDGSGLSANVYVERARRDLARAASVLLARACARPFQKTRQKTI
jgi:hypothetical protein